MNWHNFKVMFIFAVVVFAVLLFCGQPVLAFLALIAYSLYGLFDVIKAYKYKSKWDNMLSHSISQKLREIILFHITRRAKKIDKKIIQQFINDINNGNYTVRTETLTEIHSEPPKESDGGYIYYLEFDDNGSLYYMEESRIHKFKVGDVRWHVSTANHSADVVEGASGYNNLFLSEPHIVVIQDEKKN